MPSRWSRAFDDRPRTKRRRARLVGPDETVEAVGHGPALMRRAPERGPGVWAWLVFDLDGGAWELYGSPSDCPGCAELLRCAVYVPQGGEVEELGWSDARDELSPAKLSWFAQRALNRAMEKAEK